MPFLSDHLLAIAVLLIVIILLWTRRPKIVKDKLAPEPSGALPIIGHLHKLGGQVPLFRTLSAMADKYGPVFTIRFGAHRALVISSYEAIKECLTTNDKIFATRPRSSHGKYLGYNYAAFGFASYGTYWREMRKLAVMELLSNSRLESLKHVQLSEVEWFVKELYSLCRKSSNGNSIPVKVVISEWIDHLTLNIITKIIAGKKYFKSGIKNDEEAERFGKVIKEFMYVSGVPAASDLIPCLGWIDIKGQLKAMKRIGMEVDCIIGSWTEEHKLKQNRSGDDDRSNNERDFIDVMLSVIEEDQSSCGFTRETIVKATAMNLILAGSDTTSINLQWILSLLLNNKHALNRAQEELDMKIGRQKWVEDSDIKSLTYLQAIVKESLRLYPPGPLSVPHEAIEDCTVCGYHVPKGTRLFMNIWKLQRDPKFWSDPDEFRPERFLVDENEGLDASGKHFEFIPFGAGRRSCPGMNFALQVTHLGLGRLIQGFDLATEFDKKVDMSEGLGISLPKAIPVEVLLTPRLSFEMYQPPS